MAGLKPEKAKTLEKTLTAGSLQLTAVRTNPWGNPKRKGAEGLSQSSPE